MTDDRMALAQLLEKGTDSDLLREIIGYVAQRLMQLDVDGLVGAAHGERGEDRENSRNGYRNRDWHTRSGTVPLRIPKLSGWGHEHRTPGQHESRDWSKRLTRQVFHTHGTNCTVRSCRGSRTRLRGQPDTVLRLRDRRLSYPLSEHHEDPHEFAVIAGRARHELVVQAT